MNRGVLCALIAYLFWGLLPLFWKALAGVPSLEIIGHRIIWSAVLTGIILTVRRDFRWIRTSMRNTKTRTTILTTSVLIGLNWLTYIWAVNAGFILEASLGYFIHPLINVLLGVVFLRERLRMWQWIAVVFAAAGVTVMTFGYGVFPWISLFLALSFAFYGLLRKTVHLDALPGLFCETTLLSIPAVMYLAILGIQGRGAFGHGSPDMTVLLFLAGVVTALPLILFTIAARRIPLSSIGILFYIAPTLQFVLGVTVYGEPFPVERMLGFILIWIALILFTVEGAKYSHHRKQRRTSAAGN